MYRITLNDSWGFISLMKVLTSLLFKLADNSFSESFTNSINFYSLALGKHHFTN